MKGLKLSFVAILLILTANSRVVFEFNFDEFKFVCLFTIQLLDHRVNWEMADASVDGSPSLEFRDAVPRELFSLSLCLRRSARDWDSCLPSWTSTDVAFVLCTPFHFGMPVALRRADV